MAIVSADLKEYKSNATNSDGQDISATEVVDNVDNNLFTDITGDEAAAGGTEYRRYSEKILTAHSRGKTSCHGF
jgi:hypothetical protein